MTIDDATHYLHCAHQVGCNRKGYVMKCIILKKMIGKRVKIIVFGDRNWKNKNYITKIRYVDQVRISIIGEKYK